MVPKKARSKRISASRRYKTVKKVTEHHRKQRKEAKKNPQTKRAKKDPGIPNLFPGKDTLLQEAEAKKKRVAEERERQRTERRKLQEKNRGLGGELTDGSIPNKDAAQLAELFDLTRSIHSEGFSLGSTLDAVLGKSDSKAFYTDFKNVVADADIILEVLDARDPMGCRIRQIEEMVLAAKKRFVLVLNKIDLVPREVVEQWLVRLRKDFPTIAFTTAAQETGSISMNASADRATTFAQNLVSLVQNFRKNSKSKKTVTVGVVGFPNVGKASIVNLLKRTKAQDAKSSQAPSKGADTIPLADNINLLEYPGIVYSQSVGEDDEAEVLLRNCMTVELLEDPISLVDVIVRRSKPEQLVRHYNVPIYVDTRDFLVQVARQKLKLRRGGAPDLHNSARAVLQDWNAGRIPFYTVPTKSDDNQASIPSSTTAGDATLKQWTREFDLAAFVKAEDAALQADLKSKSQIATPLLVLKPSNPPAAIDMEMDEMSDEEDEEEEEEESELDDDDDDDDDEDGDEGQDEDDESDDNDDDDDEAPELVEDVEPAEPAATTPSRYALRSRTKPSPTPSAQSTPTKKAIATTPKKSPKTPAAAAGATPAKSPASKKKTSKAKSDDAMLVDEAYQFSDHFPVA